MDYADHYSATKDAIIDALAAVKPSPKMMRIDAFDAEDDGGEPVRVIGVIEDDDILKFLVIESDADGEIYPIARSHIYKKGTSVA
ncbi:hypothetical protein [Neorhizobium galegae]|uniref:hypothetical protein n=1 Tax=Neorhizobium galegae TaxID=399 RepID=UPI001270DB8B|nr:hypothetical protein [Neorhizobium galegae]KAA9386905.1 hypothetical protein F4V88_10705 [Neorhizobium galegae]MBP2560357.1 hypothetical protein [Neorhizobium galegae]MCM2498046.1 hypothetical protein [Neorhizobium galegae]